MPDGVSPPILVLLLLPQIERVLLISPTERLPELAVLGREAVLEASAVAEGSITQELEYARCLEDAPAPRGAAPWCDVK